MAKLVTKFKYLKPNGRQHIGGYAKYIATREGVERIDDSQKFAPATIRQKELIRKIIRDFPDSKEMLEYEDYLKQHTIGSASEFIIRALEDNADEVLTCKTYADYIATRPRAERYGSHGLFTDDGVQVQLAKISEELNLHGGNVWSAIISLRREDAERLGFNTGKRWRDMLRTQTEALAANLKIPMENLQWFAAFHNESHHPHVHLIAYSKIENEGYLTPKGVANLRSSFAKDIFAQDLLSVYEKKTAHRTALRQSGEEILSEIVSGISIGEHDNLKTEELLKQLSVRLSKTKGKKIYGYLKQDVKALINSIVDELAADERIAKLYDLWYQQQEEVRHIYTEAVPKRIPLSQNKEFTSIKNAVIQEALRLSAQQFTLEDENMTDDVMPVPEPLESEADEVTSVSLGIDVDADMKSEQSPILIPKYDPDYSWLLSQAEKGNRYAQYRLARLLLDRESEHYDPGAAVTWLIESSKRGYAVAQYRIGRMYLYGEHVGKDVLYAFRWLEAAERQNNQFAQYLIGKTYLSGMDVPQDIEKAVVLLSKSAEQGNRYAAFTLGKAYLDGKELPKDTDKALKLLIASADKGFQAAEYVFGKLLCRGERVPKDIPKGVAYLTSAASKGNQYAQYLLGKLFLMGEDVGKDVRQAVYWLSCSAEQKNMHAEYALGKLYLYGGDLEKDSEKAMSFLSTSAEQGNPYASYLLDNIYLGENSSFAFGSIRLLTQLGRIFQHKLEDQNKDKSGVMDKKLRSQIRGKKAAHGIWQE